MAARQTSIFKRLKPYFPQALAVYAIRKVASACVQPLDSRQSAVDDASKLGAEFRSAVFPQTLLRFFRGKPGGSAARFLRRFEPSHFAKVGSDTGTLMLAHVAGKGEFLHTPMNAGFFDRLNGGGLRLREARFDAAFRENPASATRLDQQKFHAALADAITNGGDLLPFFRKSLRKLFRALFRKPRRSRELYGRITTHVQ